MTQLSIRSVPVTVHSNFCKEIFPSNEPSNFTNRIKPALQLSRLSTTYEVGVVELSFSRNPCVLSYDDDESSLVLLSGNMQEILAWNIRIRLILKKYLHQRSD